MATKKETVATETEVKEEKKVAPKKASKAKKAEVSKPETKVAPGVKPTINDFGVILEPLITEKSMTLGSTFNMASFKVKKTANKIEIKHAIERIYGVKVVDVKTVNVVAKKTTRGSKYHGTISGFKKAIVRIADGQAIDLYKE